MNGNEWERGTHTLQNTLVIHLDLVNGGSFIRSAFLLEASVRTEGHRFLYAVRLPPLGQQRCWGASSLKRVEMVVQQRDVTLETRIPGARLRPFPRIVQFPLPDFARGMGEIGQKRGRLLQNALLARSSPDLPRRRKTWEHSPSVAFLYFGCKYSDATRSYCRYSIFERACFKNRNNGGDITTMSVFEKKNRELFWTRDVTKKESMRKSVETGQFYLLSDSRVPRTIFLWDVEPSRNHPRRGCLVWGANCPDVLREYSPRSRSSCSSCQRCTAPASLSRCGYFERDPP